MKGPMKNVLPILAVAFVVAACSRPDKSEKTGSNSTLPPSAAPPAGQPLQIAGGPAERPTPPAVPAAALANGQTVKWDQQGISWTMPADWKKKDIGKDTFVYGGADAFLTVAISTMDANFPTETSLTAMYEGAKANEKNGKYDESKWLALDGVRGIQSRESKPEKADDIRRLQWQGYRKYAGHAQLVTIVLSANGAAFPKHQDSLSAVLVSTKLAH
jgi:hypothetical protein